MRSWILYLNGWTQAFYVLLMMRLWECAMPQFFALFFFLSLTHARSLSPSLVLTLAVDNNETRFNFSVCLSWKWFFSLGWNAKNLWYYNVVHSASQIDFPFFYPRIEKSQCNELTFPVPQHHFYSRFGSLLLVSSLLFVNYSMYCNEFSTLICANVPLAKSMRPT